MDAYQLRMSSSNCLVVKRRMVLERLYLPANVIWGLSRAIHWVPFVASCTLASAALDRRVPTSQVLAFSVALHCVAFTQYLERSMTVSEKRSRRRVRLQRVDDDLH
ncbi:hypothetical protein SNK03_002570 [Fusarium graminearum]